MRRESSPLDAYVKVTMAMGGCTKHLHPHYLLIIII